MPTLAAFLADIREHPDDDTPRLVLADWLDDQGDQASVACADLIRTQGRRAWGRTTRKHRCWRPTSGCSSSSTRNAGQCH
jgi:uncharacterized protein (TIGR02996 family)